MHLGEMFRDHGLEEDVRLAEAAEDRMVWAAFLAEVLQGAAGAWASDAACKGHSETMFPVRGQSLDPARALCASCPVLDECTSWAATVPGRQLGIIAGTSERQRRQQRQRSTAPAAVSA